MNMEKVDRELIADYFEGDEKALEELFGRYFKRIYAFLYRYAGNAQDAEDIAQETFLKAWRNLKKFDVNKSFKTWLFTIAKNSAIDFLKKKRALVFSDFENAGENALVKILRDPAPTPAKLSERNEEIRGLAFSFARLPRKYGKIIFLRYDEDLSFSEIARFLGEKLNTVKSRHRRALMMLKAAFLHQ